MCKIVSTRWYGHRAHGIVNETIPPIIGSKGRPTYSGTSYVYNDLFISRHTPQNLLYMASGVAYLHKYSDGHAYAIRGGYMRRQSPSLAQARFPLTWSVLL